MTPPTTVPVFASEKNTAFNVLVVPLVRVAQVFPASVVLMTSPFTPTANPVFVSAKQTPLSELEALGKSTQIFPPSVVLRMNPF
jgi:hypothetical protein